MEDVSFVSNTQIAPTHQYARYVCARLIYLFFGKHFRNTNLATQIKSETIPSVDALAGALTFRHAIAIAMIIAISLAQFFYVSSVRGKNEDFYSLYKGLDDLEFLVRDTLDVLDKASLSADPSPQMIYRNRLSGFHKRGNVLMSDIRDRYQKSDVSVDVFAALVSAHSDNNNLIGQLLGEPSEQLVREDVRYGNAALICRQQLILLRGLKQSLFSRQSTTVGQDLMFLSYGTLWVVLSVLIIQIVFLYRPMVSVFVETQIKLLKANKEKSEFLWSVSREIRAPANGIVGASENLMNSELTEKQRAYAMVMLASAESLMDVMNDILGYSEMEEGEIELESLSFDMEGMAKDVVQFLSRRAQKKSLELVLRYSSNSPEFVVGDASRIRQILLHLMGNAIKFTQQGYIILSVERILDSESVLKESWIRISVEDTGVGIDREKQVELFKGATHLDRSTVGEFEGLGIGLEICKSLVERMGGHIGVSSASGKGTRFWCDLPLADDQSAIVTESDVSILKGKHALIFCDVAMEAVLVDQMQQLHMHVLVCHTMNELRVALLSNLQYSLAIVDSSVADSNPLDIVTALRANKNLDAYPLTLLVDNAEYGAVQDAAQLGCAAILHRPIRSKLLAKTLAMTVKAFEQGRTHEMISVDGVVFASKTKRAEQALDTDSSSFNTLLTGKTVLLVEDNRINRLLTEDMLLDLGATVICAENGLMGLDLVLSRPEIDIVFMDCMMPEMDGFDATRHIRARLKHTDRVLLVVALTANALNGDKEKCLDAGMDAYLAKPVRRKELRNVLTQWLEASLSVSESQYVGEMKQNNLNNARPVVQIKYR